MKHCSCGTPFYPLHDPMCQRHSIPLDGSPCDCCGVTITGLPPSDQRRLRARAAAEQAQP